MPRQTSVSFEQNFSNGLITQASGLNFPENACTETYDCIFKETGLVSRRPQFDIESNNTTEAFNKVNQAIATFLWSGAAAEGDFNIVVTQIGTSLFFYDTANQESLSKGFYSTSSIDMTSFVTNPDASIQECTFAVGLGYLFVYNPGITPIYIVYDPVLRTFSANAITIEIRDTKGVADGLAIDNRPTGTLSAAHGYNLYNQGWNVVLNTTTPIAIWDAGRTDFPSNADVWWDFKNPSDVFDLAYIAQYSRGNTPAPKGNVILSLFNQDRTIGGLFATNPVTTYTTRPSIGTFYAGRVWYTGIGHSDLNNNLYYSQTIENTAQFGRCYQKIDPTAEDTALLATDGGVIVIPDLGTVYRLESVGNNLLIFTSNGIWAIAGSEGIGFTAIDYTVSKVSNVRSISAGSFVNMQSVIVWWNLDGIFMLQSGQQGGFVVKSLSDQRIKDFFAGIPVLCKKQAKGSHNDLTKIVQWLYRTEVNDTFDELYEYNAVLNLNMISGAFYPWTISESNIKVNSIVTADVTGQSRFQASDVVSGVGNVNDVKDALGNQVIAFNYSSFISAVTTTKYLISYGPPTMANFTWAEVSTFEPPNDYKDWYKLDNIGVDYDSYFVSGYKLRGEGARKFQSNYLNVFAYTERESPIVFDVQARWDYAITDTTGNWTHKQRVRFDDSDSSFRRRRLKIRGQGVTVQFRFNSIPGEPFNVAGWSIWETSTAGV